jgi:hypothetical protein
MTFKQWWESHEWSFILRILFKPPAEVFAKRAWDAAVQVEREACAKEAEAQKCHMVARAIRARGQA